MNKICVFAKNKQTYFIQRLTEEVGEGVVFFNPWKDHELPVAEKYLIRTTGVYKSDLDLLLIKSLPPENVLNPLKTLEKFRSKKKQFMWFEEMDIPCLPWISLKDCEDLVPEKFLRLYPEVVVKPDIGQGGWGVEALNSETMRSWMKKHDKDYLLQPLIKNAREFRYFFIAGHRPIVLERQAKSGIASNFRKSGSAVCGELPDSVIETLERLVSLSGALYGAIDLFLDQDRLFILELNTVPGIEQLEQVSGRNVMADITTLLLR